LEAHQLKTISPKLSVKNRQQYETIVQNNQPKQKVENYRLKYISLKESVQKPAVKDQQPNSISPKVAGVVHQFKSISQTYRSTTIRRNPSVKQISKKKQ